MQPLLGNVRFRNRSLVKVEKGIAATLTIAEPNGDQSQIIIAEVRGTSETLILTEAQRKQFIKFLQEKKCNQD